MKFWSSLFLCAASSLALASNAGNVETWRDVPMPPGFQVLVNVLEGPVFADAKGRTLYKWPQHVLRNGYSGEPQGVAVCSDEVQTVTAGLMSPYPAGIELPDIDTRPSCTEKWPPVLAADDASDIGDWTIIERKDGRRQWTYKEQPLYTSIRDKQPADVLGGTGRDYGGDDPAIRVPVGPPAKVPPGFSVKTTVLGRMLGTHENYSVYAYDRDTATSTACTGECLADWQPVLAPALARDSGDWTLLERSAGVRQWVFRGKPLYSHKRDTDTWSQEGNDVAGWTNVFTQKAPPPPAHFTVQHSMAGDVLAGPDGKTIYTYNCGEDSADQLACDHPEDTQVYRIAMCGGGDAERCLEFWPYVVAEENQQSANRLWTIVRIDPMTGHFASPDSDRALRVWAYRDRPVYTFGGDEKPGDVHGAGTGEWRGKRNGLHAFWIRDDFFEGIL